MLLRGRRSLPVAASAGGRGPLLRLGPDRPSPPSPTANLLTNGNLTYDNSGVLDPELELAEEHRGQRIDQHLRPLRASGSPPIPTGSGTNSVYEFDVPILGGNLTDFFRVNQFGSTTGLANNGLIA